MAELVRTYTGEWKYQVKLRFFKRGIFIDTDDSISYRRVRTLFRWLPENKPVTMDKLGTQPLSFGFLDNHRAYLWRRPKYPVPRSGKHQGLIETDHHGLITPRQLLDI
jgi:hypothetical protein